MAMIQRAAVPAVPALAREVMPVPELGGDVIVQELTLDARLDFERALRGSARRGVMAMVPHLLAATVVLEDGEPLYTVDEWRAFGARNPARKDAAVGLFNTAMRLSGFDGEAAKKN